MLIDPLLAAYGWSERLQTLFEPHAAKGLEPGRIVVQQRGGYRLITAEGEIEGRATGPLMKSATDTGRPTAGDWVALEARPGETTALVHEILPRSSAFIRKASGPRAGAQVVAANVDVALLVASMSGTVSLRRLERYLATTYESGAAAVIVLTKLDLAEYPEEILAEVEAMALGTPIVALSAKSGEHLDQLAPHLAPGRTAVLLGTSGAGKSTLLNALAGEERMSTGAVREADDRGRHTTTHRELVLLPSGALILDTPGMRELGLWDADEGVAATFADIEALAAQCRFRDCSHGEEPGCAVQAAIDAGDLDPARLYSFEKLQAELAHDRRRQDPVAATENKKVWISRHKAGKARAKSKRGFGEE